MVLGPAGDAPKRVPIEAESLVVTVAKVKGLEVDDLFIVAKVNLLVPTEPNPVEAVVVDCPKTLVVVEDPKIGLVVVEGVLLDVVKLPKMEGFGASMADFSLPRRDVFGEGVVSGLVRATLANGLLGLGSVGLLSSSLDSSLVGSVGLFDLVSLPNRESMKYEYEYEYEYEQEHGQKQTMRVIVPKEDL